MHASKLQINEHVDTLILLECLILLDNVNLKKFWVALVDFRRNQVREPLIPWILHCERPHNDVHFSIEGPFDLIENDWLDL